MYCKTCFKIVTAGQRILTKGCIACRAVIENWMIPSVACHYWRLNDPFAVYTAAETPSVFHQAIQLPKMAPSHGDTHLIHGSLANMSQFLKRHLSQFSHFCTALLCDQHTERQTVHATFDICSNRQHLMHRVHDNNNNNNNNKKGSLRQQPSPSASAA